MVVVIKGIDPGKRANNGKKENSMCKLHAIARGREDRISSREQCLVSIWKHETAGAGEETT